MGFRMYNSIRGINMKFLALVLLTAFLSPAFAAAQNAAEVPELLAQTARHMVAHYELPVVAFDPRIAARAHRSVTGDFVGRFADNALASVVKATGAKSALQANVYSCDNGPPSCRLNNIDLFLKFGTPAFHGNRAVIYVDAMVEEGSRHQPVTTRQHEVVLQKRGGHWVVTSSRVVAIG